MSCPICFEIITPKTEYITNCNHLFCKDCIILNNINKCPLCREYPLCQEYIKINFDDLTLEQLYNKFKEILDDKICSDLN